MPSYTFPFLAPGPVGEGEWVGGGDDREQEVMVTFHIGRCTNNVFLKDGITQKCYNYGYVGVERSLAFFRKKH